MGWQTLKALFETTPTWQTPAEFAVLATLAYCTNEGEGGLARPSRTFLARQLRMKPKSVGRVIRELERRGLLARVEHGRGRRASRYDVRGCVPAPSEGAYRDPLGTTPTESTDPAATAREDLEGPSAGAPVDPLRVPVGTPICTDKDRSEEIRTAAQTPRFPHQASDPNRDNYRVILAIAHELINTFGFTRKDEADLIEATKQKCAEMRIDYGRHHDVDFNVVHRACASALCARIVNGSGRHRTVSA